MIPVAVDPAGNVYTLIHTNTDAIIQGDTIQALTASQGIVITKFDTAGNLLWGKMVNCDGGVLSAEKLAVDNTGAVYASYTFGNGGQVHLADTTFLPSIGGHYALIIKLDSSGNFIHARSFDGGTGLPVSCLGTDLYIGLFEKIEKLDSALNTVWTVSAPPGLVYFDDGNGEDIYVSPNGKLVASGYEYSNNLDTVPFGDDSIYFSVPGPNNEVIVVTLDTTGHVLWTKALHLGSGVTPVKAVCLDSHGNAYLGAYYCDQQNIFGNDTLVNNFGTGPYCAILKWDSAGTPANAIGIYAFSSQPNIFDLAVNAQDELLVSGSDGIENVSINGDTVVFINATAYLFKFDAAGNFVWHKPGPGSGVYGDGIAVRNGNEYIQGGSTGNTGTFTFGCLQYTTPVQSNFVSLISENPEWNPVASFTYTVANDTTYNFSDQSTDASSWHWDFGDGDTSNAQNPSHDFTAGGNYTVILTVHHGICSSVDTVQIVGVGINEITQPISFSLSPNPACTNVIIHFEKAEKNKIQLKNFLGEIISETENSSAEIKMNISYLPVGIYFITVIDERNNSVTKKIVKM